jgi:hypothetical protein
LRNDKLQWLFGAVYASTDISAYSSAYYNSSYDKVNASTYTNRPAWHWT